MFSETHELYDILMFFNLNFLGGEGLRGYLAFCACWCGLHVSILRCCI